MAVALVVVLLSACQWPQPGFGPEHRRHNVTETELTVDNVASLTEVWSAVPGAVTEPIVADGRVYVTRDELGAEAGVWVRALSAESGETIWDRQIASGNFPIIVTTPNARFGSRLSTGYLALSAGQCVAGHGDLDPADGSGAVAQDDVVVSPAVTSGSIVVRTTSALSQPPPCGRGAVNVVATDVSTGDELWTAPLEPGSAPGMPTVADGRVFVAAGGVHAYPARGCGATTCSPLWSIDLTTNGMAPVAGHQGQVFLISEEGEQTEELVSVSARRGREQWRADLDVDSGGLNAQPATVAVAGNVVYVTTPGTGGGADQLKAFAADGCGAPTCTPLWSATLGSTPSAPVVAGGVVYVGTDGAVQAYDAAGCGATNCSPITTIPTDGWAGNLSVAQGKLFVNAGGTVSAYAPRQD